MDIPILRTLSGEVVLEDALREERNMLLRLTFQRKAHDFETYLYRQRSEIERLVSFHLGLRPENCQLTQPLDWIHGSFNICIPVDVCSWAYPQGKRVIVRFPLPYKTGELERPGNSDEKLRCEAATYLWIGENCPDVPIPRLWGFAFSDGYSFTTPEIIPIYIRLIQYIRRRLFSLLGYPVPCQYIRSRNLSNLKTGYLLIDYIAEEDGVMLSESWKEMRHDKARRSNLFTGLSKIMLSLSRILLPRIGSFTINNDGVLSLTNRPLTLQLQQLENEGIPSNLDRESTYTTIEPYLLDLLALHDSRLRCQPNAINDAADCQNQMAVLSGMRAVLHHFYSRKLRHGPFLFTLTDIHQSNIFVDADWCVKYVIDLEWACSLPIEMQHPPHWLTDRKVDQLDGEYLNAFNEIREEFMNAFEREERALSRNKQLIPPRTQTMQQGWETGLFFYFHALDSTVGLFTLFWQHVQPKFARSHVLDTAFERILAPYWVPQADDFISIKIEEKASYNGRLQHMFEDGAE